MKNTCSKFLLDSEHTKTTHFVFLWIILQLTLLCKIISIFVLLCFDQFVEANKKKKLIWLRSHTFCSPIYFVFQLLQITRVTLEIRVNELISFWIPFQTNAAMIFLFPFPKRWLSWTKNIRFSSFQRD